jgi:hypothetical protein
MKKVFKAFYLLLLFSLLAGCATTTARTPLMKAVEGGNSDAVRQLLNGGVNVNEKSDYDIGPGGKEWTALHLAGKRGDVNITRLLLDHGADPGIRTKFGWTPLKWAEHSGNTFVAKMLREAMEKDAKKPPEDARVAYETTERPQKLPIQPAVESGPVKDRPKIAVWDLASRNTPVTHAQELTSILVSEISKMGRYEVYSQENVRTLAGWTAEKMALGCTDTKCLTALGQMDVGKLISGSVGKIGDTYSISLNLFDTQNAKAEKSISEFCRSENELIGLLQQGVRKLLAAGP